MAQFYSMAIEYELSGEYAGYKLILSYDVIDQYGNTDCTKNLLTVVPSRQHADDLAAFGNDLINIINQLAEQLEVTP